MWLGISHLMVRGFAGRVKPGQAFRPLKRTVIGTLLLSDIGLTNVTAEAGMGGAALRIMFSRLDQAELAVDGQAHVAGVGVLLAVVFPPANRAQSHRLWGFKSLESAAWAAKSSCDGIHSWVDGKDEAGFTEAKLPALSSRLSTPRFH